MHRQSKQMLFVRLARSVYVRFVFEICSICVRLKLGTGLLAALEDIARGGPLRRMTPMTLITRLLPDRESCDGRDVTFDSTAIACGVRLFRAGGAVSTQGEYTRIYENIREYTRIYENIRKRDSDDAVNER